MYDDMKRAASHAETDEVSRATRSRAIVMSLLDDICTHIIDRSYPLSAICRETLVLAAELKSEEVKAWVLAELNGYSSEASLPGISQVRRIIEGDWGKCRREGKHTS